MTATNKLGLDDVVHTPEFTIGALIVPDRTGHTPTMWDTRDQASVEAVRAQFDQMVKANHMFAYKVDEKAGNTGEQIRDFDPEAERIVVAYPLAGG